MEVTSQRLGGASSSCAQQPRGTIDGAPDPATCASPAVAREVDEAVASDPLAHEAGV